MENIKLTKKFIDELSQQLKSKIILYKRFKSGRANPVFLLKLANKKEYVLKLYLEWKIKEYKNDISIFNLFSNNKLVPNRLFNGNWNNGKYAIITKINGKNMEEINLKKIPQRKINKIFFDIGKLVAQLHSVRNTKFGRIYSPKFKSWKSFLQDLNKKYLRKLEISEFAYLRDYIKNYLDKNINLIKDVKKGSFIHDDVQLQNILIDKDKLAGIIDFDRSFFGDPMYELPYCETGFYRFISKKNRPIMLKSFYKGYLSIRKLDKKRYDLVEDYYYVCKYLRHMIGFKSLKKILPKKVSNEIKTFFISEVKRIIK
jgi:aminoglycoside phosphotransferase (APT) family kinase protein|tara:strand:+ start:1161 stop:2102 length:942 start_codon:yes stop_codon:yes gene_type:complete